MSQNTLPIGQSIPPFTPPSLQRQTLTGQFITLTPLNPDQDIHDLYDISHGTDPKHAIWTYLSYGPFPHKTAMYNWLTHQATHNDPLFFTVKNKETQACLGMVSFLNNIPTHRRLELGHIWYGLNAQRTKTNTEAIYLMLTHTFQHLHYRRAEWKCDALNARSRAAALRLGFQYEGTFRQHIIYKNRNRDTAWFSLLDTEWPTIKANMEQWLYTNTPHLSLTALNIST